LEFRLQAVSLDDPTHRLKAELQTIFGGDSWTKITRVTVHEGNLRRLPSPPQPSL
jgi:hypothetical protein